MSNKAKVVSTFEKITAILLGVFAIYAIRSIFEDDNSKIVSKKGRNLLSDSKKMKKIYHTITESELNNQHQDVLIPNN